MTYLKRRRLPLDISDSVFRCMRVVATRLSATLAVCALTIPCTTSPAFAQPMFMGLGDLPGGPIYSFATSVSADGSVAVGVSASASGFGGLEAFRWNATTGIVGLGDLPGGPFGDDDSVAADVSADGSVVVGSGTSASGQEAFRWTAATGMVGLGDLPGGSFRSIANATSADGSVVVGLSDSGGANSSGAFRWTAATGMVNIDPGGFHFRQANDVSSDGSFIVGQAGNHPFAWTQGSGISSLPGWGPTFREPGRANAVSADGAVIVGEGFLIGTTSSRAFRWESGIVEHLGILPGTSLTSFAFDVSADGWIVVGRSGSPLGTDPSDKAFLWDPANGIRSVQDLLVQDFGLDLTGWSLTEATGISADGLTIVGNGLNPAGNREGWIAILRVIEVCDDGIDNDKDGLIDKDDLDCLICGDGILDPGEECDDGNTTDGDRCSAACEIENERPSCAAATASVSALWPPDHAFADVSVEGVTDADGDPISITVDSIRQDEPVLGRGDGNTAPDAGGVGTDVASVRVERAGSRKLPGDGRVYHIGFTAEDGQGGECSGDVTVCVPHDRSPGEACVDQGSLFDSTSTTNACGLGFELALVLPGLMRLLRRRRRLAA